MAKSLTRDDQTKRERKLYLREWMAYQGRVRGRPFKQNEIAKAAGVSESHIANVLANRRGRADQKGYGLNTDSLLGISELLGITINDLFKPPPERDVLEQVTKIGMDQPLTLRQLMALRDVLVPTGEKK